MKRKLDRVAVAMGIAGVVTYAYGVDQSMWSRAALGAGMVVFGFAVKEIGIYTAECQKEQEERESERRDAVFAAWIRSGSLKEGGKGAA